MERSPDYDAHTLWLDWTTMMSAGVAWGVHGWEERIGRKAEPGNLEPFIAALVERGDGIGAPAYLGHLERLQLRAPRDREILHGARRLAHTDIGRAAAAVGRPHLRQWRPVRATKTTGDVLAVHVHCQCYRGNRVSHCRSHGTATTCPSASTSRGATATRRLCCGCRLNSKRHDHGQSVGHLYRRRVLRFVLFQKRVWRERSTTCSSWTSSIRASAKTLKRPSTVGKCQRLRRRDRRWWCGGVCGCRGRGLLSIAACPHCFQDKTVDWGKAA